MKKSIISISMAAIMSFSIMTSSFSAIAEEITENVETVKVEDIASTLYTITYDLNGGKGILEKHNPMESGTEVELSIWILEKEGFFHVGWTDGENTYKRGELISMPEKNLELKALYAASHSVTYDVGPEVKAQGYSGPPNIEKIATGETIKLSANVYSKEGFKSDGWICNGIYYPLGAEFTIPDEDVLLDISWTPELKLIYDAGEVDGVVGAQTFVFINYKGEILDLSAPTRLVRIGYKIIGWYDKENDISYQPYGRFIMPDTDKTVYAIWEPKLYYLRFDPNGGVGTTEVLSKIYDQNLTIPECSFTNGDLKFAGWEYNGDIYQPGEEFKVHLDSLTGSFKFFAVWKENVVQETIFGDIDDDKKPISNKDMVYLCQCLINDAELTEQGKLNADLNKDGQVDVADLAILKQYIMGDEIVLGK